VFVKSKRQSKVASVDASTGEEPTFNCDICTKTFRKADSLAKHKMTLTHIAKLSEQEFLSSELQKEADAKAAAAREEAAKVAESEKSPATSIDALEKIAIEASLAVADVAANAKTLEVRKSTPTRAQPSPKATTPGPVQLSLSPTSKRTATPVVPNQSGIEPISSPEHLEPSSYAKYSSVSAMRNTAAKPASAATAYENSRMALSQEEKLFFECCSMLKDSKPSRHTSATATRQIPIQPNDAQYDNNERGAGVSNLVYSVKSPMSNSRSSPRPAFPKIDANQFSDISSDSNPIIFPGRNQYAAKHKIFTSIMNEDVHLPNFMSSAERYLNSFPSVSAMGQPEATQGATLAAPSTHSQVNQQYAADSFSDDMAESFPYSQGDVSESENYAQEPDVGEMARSQTPLSSKNNSPAHSAASSCSEVSKFRTKGALKGFDNLKVSIPTTCLDLEQALLKSAESKLAALADIALMGSTGGTSDLNLKTPLDSALLPTLTSPKKPTAAAKKNVLGNNLGFKVTKKNAKKSKATPVPSETNDVYDFDEFADAEEGPEKSSFRSKQPTAEPQADAESAVSESPAKDLPQLAAAEDSQQSATSYSDRDDCTFGVASPSTSNAEDGSDDSDSEDSTGVSSMALSKRIKRSIAIEANIEQKKSLIWGRIFKKKEKVDEKVATTVQKAEPRDYDRMFDTLRQPGEKEEKVVEKALPKPQPEKAKKKATGKDTQAPNKAKKTGDLPAGNDRRSKHVKNKNIFTEIIDNATIIPELKKSGRSREVAKLEAEWQMSVEEIEEIIGIGNRKSTRRCAAGKQKILAETWSSDDFEDFQGNTEDVIKMIETADAGDAKKGGE
jgi:hypothetical protein